MSRHVLFRALGAFVAASALTGLLAWRFEPDAALEATIRVIPEKGRVVTRKARILFAQEGKPRPVHVLEVDLSRWRGRLVRVAVTGTLRARRGEEVPSGFVGCSASLTDGTRERPLEFVGWRNRGRERLHVGTLGAPTFRGPDREGHAFVYGRLGDLWTVLPAQPKQRLKLFLTPILIGDLSRHGKTYLPGTPKPWQAGWGGPPPGESRPPDVFIYLIDALRADHVGCYGYDRPTTPELDRFAREAAVYEQAQTAATWTRPSVASLLTGLYPSAHDVMHMEKDKLDAWPVTIPEALHGPGYQTLYVCSNGHASGHYGFLQGVDRSAYRDEGTARWSDQEAARLLAEADPNRPVFMYLHTIGPHSPYLPKPGTLRLFDHNGRAAHLRLVTAPFGRGKKHGSLTEQDVQCLRDRYDAEIRESDAGFGQFLSLLKRAGRYDNALIIVLADHGEAFGEHGTFFHGGALTAEELHVPLLIRYPGGRNAGRRVATRVSLIDIFPTVMAATGARPRLSYGLAGRDLQPLAADPGRAAEVPIFAEVSMHRGNKLDLVGVIDESGYKRVFDLSSEPGVLPAESSLGLWRLSDDPLEQNDLTRDLPLRAAYDEALVAHYLVAQRWWRGPTSTGKPAVAPITPGMQRHLHALGYLK